MRKLLTAVNKGRMVGSPGDDTGTTRHDTTRRREMTMTTNKTQAKNARPTCTGVERAIDLDVHMHDADMCVMHGEVTLAWDGRWAPYGTDPAMWVSGGLLARLRATDLDEADELDMLAEVAAEAATKVYPYGPDEREHR